MRGKIVKAFLTVISILLISEAFFFAMYLIVTDRYKNTIDDLVSEYQLIGKTSNLVNSFYDLIQYNNDQQRIGVFNDNLASLRLLLEKLDKNIFGKDSWIIYSGVKNTVKGVMDETDKGVKELSAGDFSEVTAYYLEAGKKNSFVRQNMANLLLKELESAEKFQVQIAKVRLLNIIFGLLLFFAVLAGCFWYSLYFSKKIIKPLLKLTQWSGAVKSGNFDLKIDEDVKKGNDETAVLARSLDSLALSLKENTRKMKDCGAQLNTSKKNATDKEAEIRALNETSRLKDYFVDIMAQELKTSLMPIASFAEMIEKKSDILPPDYRKYIAIIHEEGIKLGDLTKQMSQAVGKEDQVTEERERFCLDELLRSIEAPLNISAERTGSRVVFNIKDTGLDVNSIKKNIVLVVRALVSGAVKYGPNGQTIIITLVREGGNKARVEIKDEGPAIPGEAQNKLFSRPSQMEDNLPPSRKGFSLALYVCKWNIEKIGGSIGVSSEEGQGAIFYFSLPLITG